jgi:hypothetical protein
MAYLKDFIAEKKAQGKYNSQISMGNSLKNNAL